MTTTAAHTSFKPASYQTVAADQFISQDFCRLNQTQREDLLEALKIYVSDDETWKKIFKNDKKVLSLGTFQESYEDWKEEMRFAILDFMPNKEEDDESFDNYGVVIVEGHPYYEYSRSNKDNNEDRFINYYIRRYGFEESVGSYLEWVDGQMKRGKDNGLMLLQKMYIKWKVSDFRNRLDNEEKLIVSKVGYIDQNSMIEAYRVASYGEGARGLSGDELEKWIANKISDLFPPEDQEETGEEEPSLSKAIASSLMAFSPANRNAGKASQNGASDAEITQMFEVWWNTNFIEKVSKVCGGVESIPANISGNFILAPITSAEMMEMIAGGSPKFKKGNIIGLQNIKNNLLRLWEFKVTCGIAGGTAGTSSAKYGKNVGSVSSNKFGKAGKKEPVSNTKDIPAVSNGGRGFLAYVE